MNGSPACDFSLSSRRVTSRRLLFDRVVGDVRAADRRTRDLRRRRVPSSVVPIIAAHSAGFIPDAIGGDRRVDPDCIRKSGLPSLLLFGQGNDDVGARRAVRSPLPMRQPELPRAAARRDDRLRVRRVERENDRRAREHFDLAETQIEFAAASGDAGKAEHEPRARRVGPICRRLRRDVQVLHPVCTTSVCGNSIPRGTVPYG